MPAHQRAASPAAIKMGQRIKARRIKSRVSREQLGMDVGVTGQQIARYESGENVISSVMLQKLAAALECSPLVFLADTEPRHFVGGALIAGSAALAAVASFACCEG